MEVCFLITIVICILCVAIPAFYIFQARKGHSILTLAVTTFISIMLAIGTIVFVQSKQFFPVIGASLIGVALTDNIGRHESARPRL